MRMLRRTTPLNKRRGGIKRAIAIWAAVAGAAFMLGKTTHHYYKAHQEQNRPVHTRTANGVVYANPTLPKRQIIIPKKALDFPDVVDGNLCTRYVHHAAKNIFGLEYKPGDAWDFARINKSIWRGATTNVEEISQYLRPGQAIGLFNPRSNYNDNSRLYTHTALYLGTTNGNYWIMQRVGMNNKIEPLQQFLQQHQGWKIMEVIEPSETNP